jgi:serine/threonine-protein kinase
MHPSSAESERVTEIGKYHLIAELARGGMGIVHLAAAHGPGGFNKLLVIKELKPELSGDPSYVAMFLDEARLAARLTHPNIAQTMEVASDGDRHYMVMEFLDGRSFHRLGRRFRGLSTFTVGAQIRIIADSLLGLHHAHELQDFDGRPLGVVHRDVSPLNVFVTFDGQTKLLDFGIAKSVHSTLQTQAGILKGRIAYMAPEQAWGHKVDRRADVYSAGVMIWEAAAGRRLWQGMTDMETLTSVLRDTPPGLRKVRPDAPADLDAICARAMARRPEDRYETAAALFDALEKHLATRSDAMAMREIGALAARTFAEERRRVKGLIEETMLRMQSGLRSGVMPRLEPHERDTPSSIPVVPRAGEANAASRIIATRPVVESPSVTAPPVSASANPVAPSARTAHASGASARSRGLAVKVASTVGLLVAAGALLQASARIGIPSKSQVQAGAVAPSMQAPEATEFVELVIRAAPPWATITVDGVSVPANPFVARYAKDSLLHQVVISAEGYDSKLEELAFANDLSLDVSLERAAPPPPGSSAPAPASKRALSSK